MSDFWGKFDAELQSIYSNYLLIKGEGAENLGWVHPAAAHGGALSLLMQFIGDISEIEDRGFKTTWNGGQGLARGDIEFEDLEAVASHPNVIQLEYGMEPELYLDTSVPEIKARGAGSSYVWNVNESTGAFKGKTGSGVIIGIIDTGIDFRHPVFFKTSSPKTTRILRIWDQGLIKNDKSPKKEKDKGKNERSPDATLLQSSFTYGVEYKKELLDKVLQGTTTTTDATVRHKDCNGHGTHVASIAAGNGSAQGDPIAPFPKFHFVGVAPKADLIVVKSLHLQKWPKKSGPKGNDIGFSQLLQDAVTYIQAVAKNRPVVINFSGGNSIGPHDGLTAGEVWMTNHFAPSKKGRAFVTAAGNSAGKRQHAIITIPSTGSVEVPFELYDMRINKTDFNKCTYKNNTRNLYVDLWFTEVAPSEVSASLKLPGTPSFIAPAVRSGDDDLAKEYDGGKWYVLSNTTALRIKPPGAIVIATNIRLRIEPKPKGDKHLTGIYTIKLTGPSGVKIHAWCSQTVGHGFKLPNSLPTGVKSEDKNTVGSPGGARNVITVAAYNDTDGKIYGFSSQGPLADYSGGGPYEEKPDLAAPGVEVIAAASDFADPKKIIPGLWVRGYIPKKGTSMAAPHVAGAIALLLDKKGDLTTADIAKHLRDKVDPVPPVNTFGKGKLNVKAAFDAVP